VDDLLLLARIDEGTLELRREPVDLDDLVQDEAARLRAMTLHRIVTDHVESVRLDADGDRLGEVLRNLGENAARHAGSTIAFELSRRDGLPGIAGTADAEGIPAA